MSGREGVRVLARAERLGLLHPVGGDAYEAPSPSLLAVAEEVVAQGISLDAALGVFEDIERHCDGVARAFVKVFLAEVWRPFQRAGMPPDRWPEIDRAIERLRPLSSQAVLAIFGGRMSAQIGAITASTLLGADVAINVRAYTKAQLVPTFYSGCVDALTVFGLMVRSTASCFTVGSCSPGPSTPRATERLICSMIWR